MLARASKRDVNADAMKNIKTAKVEGAAKAVASVSHKVAFKARSWARHAVMALQMTGVDAALCWLGSEISDRLCNSLQESRAKLLGSKLGAFDKVLVVEASKVFAWAVSVNGDTYARRDGLLTVRGSIALLRSVYGLKNVSLVANGTAADKLTKGKKWDKGCREALQLK